MHADKEQADCRVCPVGLSFSKLDTVTDSRNAHHGVCMSKPGVQHRPVPMLMMEWKESPMMTKYAMHEPQRYKSMTPDRPAHIKKAF